MAKKKAKLPKEIKDLVEEVESKQGSNTTEQDIFIPYIEAAWDFPIDSKIEFFDTNCSYELTGYKPISKDKGLDFDPSWFTEARDTFLRTGHYTEYRIGSKAYADYWDEQYRRCRYGMTSHGYTITGDNYFFLNFFQLMDLDNTEKAGGGRMYIFPAFYAGQYEMFHYIEMCRRLRLNACIMKSREVGYSEILSAITANSYNSTKNTINIVTAFNSEHLNNTLSKAWNCLSFLNDYTDGGFFKLRQVVDKQDHKKASVFKMINGQKIETGWMSQIIGIVADKPNKIRGYRADMLIFEEAGSWQGLAKAYVQSTALVGPAGSQWGLRLVGGTSGDTKAALDGLKKMFYDPKAFGILPFRHSYTQLGEQVLTAYFVPCTKIPKDRKRFLEARGYVDEDKVKAWQEEIRATMINTPEVLMTHCAEFPFTDTEAFSSGNTNKFNKLYITEQLTKIRALKQYPDIEIGYLEYSFKDKKQDKDNITGFRWIPHQSGNIKILEHPLWLLPEEKDDNGKVIWTPPAEQINNLYVIGIDGIDIGSMQTSENTKDPSDFCLVVKKRAYGLSEPKYVAIYKDRPKDIREAYKITIRLAQYYNATINIEATRQSIIPWARDRKFLKYFMKRPRATLSESVRNTNKQYGTPATVAIIEHQTDLIADFINDYYYSLWFDEMLEELNNYTVENKRKFDIVAAMGMAELADEELAGNVPKIKEEVVVSTQDIGYYTDENGVKHWGVIPNQNPQTINYTFDINVDLGYRTSNSQLYLDYY